MKVTKIWDLELFPNDWALTERRDHQFESRSMGGNYGPNPNGCVLTQGFSSLLSIYSVCYQEHQIDTRIRLVIIKRRVVVKTEV